MPGLIGGAHEGAGLGIRFLSTSSGARLAHLVDAAALAAEAPGGDAEDAVATIENELASFQPELARRERVLVATKADAATPEQIRAVARVAKKRGLAFFTISAAARQGLEPLVTHLGTRLDALAAEAGDGRRAGRDVPHRRLRGLVRPRAPRARRARRRDAAAPRPRPDLYVPAYHPPHKPASPSAPAHHRFACSPSRSSRIRICSCRTSRSPGAGRRTRSRRCATCARSAGTPRSSSSSDRIRSPRSRRGGPSVSSCRSSGRRRRAAGCRTGVARRDTATRRLGAVRPEGARPGAEASELSIFWGGNLPVTISSTWLRRAIPAGEDLSGGLPANVAAYLRKHGLYRLP